MGTAAGLLAWPFIAVDRMAQRLDRRWLLALTASAWCLYPVLRARSLFPRPGARAEQRYRVIFQCQSSSLQHAGLLLRLLGLPFTREGTLRPAGVAIGAALFFIAAWAVASASFSNRLNTHFDRIAIGLICSSGSDLTLAAVGRSDLIDGVKVPVHYHLRGGAPRRTAVPLIAAAAATFRQASRFAHLKCAAGLGFAGLLLFLQIVISGRSAVQIARPIARDADCYAGRTAGPVSPIVTHWPEMPKGAHRVAPAGTVGAAVARLRRAFARLGGRFHKGADGSRPWRQRNTRHVRSAAHCAPTDHSCRADWRLRRSVLQHSSR